MYIQIQFHLTVEAYDMMSGWSASASDSCCVWWLVVAILLVVTLHGKGLDTVNGYSGCVSLNKLEGFPNLEDGILHVLCSFCHHGGGGEEREDWILAIGKRFILISAKEEAFVLPHRIWHRQFLQHFGVDSFG